MVKLVLVSPKNELINGEFDFVLAKGDLGEVGILENRSPIIIKITDGYIKATSNDKNIFAVISNGILDNCDSVVNVVAEEACLGDTLEEAKEKLEKMREEQKNSNRVKKIDFVEAEKELAKAIKESKASKIWYLKNVKSFDLAFF